MNHLTNKTDLFELSIYGEIKRKPLLTESFFPYDSSKGLITISSETNSPFMEDLLSILNPFLRSKDIVFLSSSKQTIRQALFLMRRAELHICLDDWTYDLCKSQNINNHLLVSSTKLEDSICQAFDILNIAQQPSFETVFVGPSYGDRIFEIIPNFTLRAKPNISAPLIVVRCDLHENWSFVIDLIQYGYRPLVIANTLPKRPISALCRGVSKINLLLNENILPEEIIDMTSLGIHIRGLLVDDSPILKERFFDIPDISLVDNWGKKNIDKLSEVSDNTCIRSKKIILDQENKLYSSIFHWRKKIPLSSQDGDKVLDGKENLEFLQEAESFYYYKNL